MASRGELETAIATHVRGGDLRAAATEALRGYGPEILGYLCAVLRDEETAAESFSRFAEDLWKGLPGFRGESTFRTWAYRVAWNAACDELDDAYHKRARRLATSEISRIAAQVRSSSAEYLRDAAKDRLKKMRDALDPEEQSLLVLRVNRGLSWKEVGQVLAREGEQIDPAALRKRFERLKEKLRRLSRAGE